MQYHTKGPLIRLITLLTDCMAFLRKHMTFFKMIQYTARPSNRPMPIDRALLTEGMAFVKKNDSCDSFGVFSWSVSLF